MQGLKIVIRTRHLIHAICWALVSIGAHAEAGWTDYASVLELTPTIQERFLTKLAVSENPSGCKSKQSFYQDYTLNGADKMFEVLLDALVSGKKVRVYVTGKCDLDSNSEISSVSIKP